MPVSAENTTETLGDSTVIHHIDISSKYNYDTIGAIGDTVNANSIYWYGYNNNNTTKASGTYGYTFTAEAQGYPSSLSYFKKYENIFVLNGHSHHGFGSSSGTPFHGNGFIQINGPVLCNQAMKRGYDAGSGYYVNIYDDRVTFRARDIENGIWLREYDMTFELTAASEATVLGEITVSDYDTAASAAGKTVDITVPVTVAEENVTYKAILAVYGENNKLPDVKLSDVTASGNILYDDITFSADTKEIKVMLCGGLENMTSKCTAVSK